MWYGCEFWDEEKRETQRVIKKQSGCDALDWLNSWI